MKYQTITALFIILTFSATQTQAQTNFAQFGYYAQSMLEGICLATQDNIANLATACYTSCAAAGAQIVTMANSSNYNAGTYNTGDFSNYGNVFLIQLMSAFNACQYTTFMVQVNNRLNDVAFFAGLVGNLGTQLAMYSSSPQPAVYTTYNAVYPAIVTIFSATSTTT